LLSLGIKPNTLALQAKKKTLLFEIGKLLTDTLDGVQLSLSAMLSGKHTVCPTYIVTKHM